MNAKMYEEKGGISKLTVVAHSRHEFEMNQYQVVGNEVRITFIYALEH